MHHQITIESETISRGGRSPSCLIEQSELCCHTTRVPAQQSDPFQDKIPTSRYLSARSLSLFKKVKKFLYVVSGYCH